MTDKQYNAFKKVCFKFKLIRQGKEPAPDDKLLEFAESVIKNADEYRKMTIAQGRRESMANEDIGHCQWAITKFKSGGTAAATTTEAAEPEFSTTEFPAIRDAIGDEAISSASELYGLVIKKSYGGYTRTKKGEAYLAWVRGQIAEERAAGTYTPRKATVNEQKLLRDAVDAER